MKNLITLAIIVLATTKIFAQDCTQIKIQADELQKSINAQEYWLNVDECPPNKNKAIHDKCVKAMKASKLKELNITIKKLDDLKKSNPSCFNVSPSTNDPIIVSNGPTTFNTGGNVTLSSNASSNNQWYSNGVIINGQTSQNLVVTQAGDYSVKTTQNGFTQNFSNTIHVTVNITNPCQSNITKSNFGTFHPCGVAVSKTGKVAICTYEGDNKNGHIFIWNSFDNFNNNICPNYDYLINDPEALVFDNNETLFISDTYEGKIYYTNNITVQPTNYFYISGDNNGNGHTDWNPRGLAVDANNNLYVMCENLSPVSPSQIIKVTNAINAVAITKSVLTGSKQKKEHAIGVYILGNQLYATDLLDYSVKAYSLDNNSITLIKTLQNAGLTLDVTSDGTYAYFTNTAGYLVKWNLADLTDTKNINLGTDGTYSPWGVVLYGNNLIVADAFHNKVQVYDKNNAPWQ